MLVLYGNPLSTYCAKVRVVLRFKALAFEDRPPPDGYGSQAYRAIVPMGTIPGFIDGQMVLSESEAIVEYLEERFPSPPLLFGDAGTRAHIRTLSRVHDCWVEPQLRALFPHARPEARDAGFVAAKVEAFHRRLSELAALASPNPFLAGDALSLADCAWATTLIQAELLFVALGQVLELPASLVSWRAELITHPAVSPGLYPCETSMRTWLEGCGAL